jgi:hypothetical protein
MQASHSILIVRVYLLLHKVQFPFNCTGGFPLLSQSSFRFFIFYRLVFRRYPLKTFFSILYSWSIMEAFIRSVMLVSISLCEVNLKCIDSLQNPKPKRQITKTALCFDALAELRKAGYCNNLLLRKLEELLFPTPNSNLLSLNSCHRPA